MKLDRAPRFEVVIVSGATSPVIVRTVHSADEATLAFHDAHRQARHDAVPREVRLHDLHDGGRIVLRAPLRSSASAAST